MNLTQLEESLIEEFLKKFQREDGLIDKYVYTPDETEEMGFAVLSTPEAIAEWLHTALSRYKEGVVGVVEGMYQKCHLHATDHYLQPNGDCDECREHQKDNLLIDDIIKALR